MLISHRKKFIFIHIPKTAGTSVNKVFVPYARLVDQCYYRFWLTQKLIFVPARIFKIKKLAERVTGFHKHAYAINVQRKMNPQKYDSYFKFTIVRNPYDWLISLYYYILDHPEHYLHTRIKAENFENFIAIQINENKLNTQSDYLTNEKEQLIVDHIAKFENIEQELTHLTNKLGIKYESVPFLNKTRSRLGKQEELYSNKTYSQVNKHFKKDFEEFGYEMKGA